MLLALSEATGLRVPEYEDWLIARTATPVKGSRLGLYDGLAGVAYTLARLGHADAALRTARACLDERWERLGSSLYGGPKGVSRRVSFERPYIGFVPGDMFTSLYSGWRKWEQPFVAWAEAQTRFDSSHSSGASFSTYVFAALDNMLSRDAGRLNTVSIERDRRPAADDNGVPDDEEASVPETAMR